MKAIVWSEYGPPDLLRLQDVAIPAPREDEVLIKVHAATVTAGDCETRSFSFPIFYWPILRLYLGIRRPRIKILGQELAGEIEAVGRHVTRFKPGDPVFAATLGRLGAYAEYACLPEAYVMRKPANMTYEEAATIPTGGINGLHFVRKASLQPGDQVLINGAGGSIGTYAVQIARLLGAEVTCVDSARKADMLRAIGAQRVIDYAQEDFTASGEAYDAIIDVVGKSSFMRSIRSLKPDGRYILGNPSLSGMIRGGWTSMTTDKRVIFEMARYRPEDYLFLTGLIEAGKLKVVIDKRYALEQVPEAHRYVEKGEKIGNVVICVEHNDAP